MKTIAVILVLLGVAGGTLPAGAQWLASLPDAVAQAKSENKNILLDFTGSDWCGWCMKLDSETFSKPEFLDYAHQHLILVQVDFPKDKAQSAETRQANHVLQEKYGVHGYPTVIELSPDGAVLCKQVGFLAGGPAAMIAKLGGNASASVPPPAPKPVPEPENIAAEFPGTPMAHKPDDQPHLQGIFYSSSHPIALLDGKNCGEGDVVNGLHVLKIQPDTVTVEWKGQTNELSLK